MLNKDYLCIRQTLVFTCPNDICTGHFLMLALNEDSNNTFIDDDDDDDDDNDNNNKNINSIK